MTGQPGAKPSPKPRTRSGRDAVRAVRAVRTRGLVLVTWAGMLLAIAGCTSNQASVVDAWRPPAGHASIDRFELLRKAADQEALYTLAGGLKPMSSGIWRGAFETTDPDFTELRDVRQALGHLRNEVWYADVQIFDTDDDGDRRAQAYVVHRNALARMIERLESFWSPWGITPCTHPSEIIAIVDRMPRADRWRGYGHLFGYPDEAVDFFVAAGLAITDENEVGPGKDREFIQIPTHVSDSGRFTYAVPLNHVPTPADRRLAEGAALILGTYEGRRSRMNDVADVVEILLQLNERFECLTLIEVTENLEGTAPSPW